MKPTLFILLTLVLSNAIQGQNLKIIEGNTIDETTGAVIPFVNIVLKQNNRGLMSNEQGFFQFNYEESYATDTLQFSCIGYKLTSVPVNTMFNKQVAVKLTPHAFELAEHIVTPLSPEEFIKRAVSKIPDNYANVSSLSSGYYYELVSENNQFLKYEEAVTDTWVPAISDTTNAHTSILYARKAKDLVELQFMKEKRDKKALKEEKKREKELAKNPENTKGENSEDNAGSEVIAANFGGPSGVLDSDPARSQEAFMQEENFKKFNYSFDPQVTYGDKTLIVIRFEQKKKIDQVSADGKVYIDLISDAIVAIEYTGTYHIPTAIKPILFALGYGIENPSFSSIVHYRENNHRWYLNSVKRDIRVKMTKKHMFSKNEVSTFDIEQAYVTQQLKTEAVTPIAAEYRMKNDKDMTEQARYSNGEFWDKYVVVRPKKLSAYLNQ